MDAEELDPNIQINQSNTSWRRVKNESAKDYALFVEYKNKGSNRTLVGFVKEYNQNPSNQKLKLGTVKVISAKNKWNKRCEDYDLNVAEKKEKTLEDHRKELEELDIQEALILKRAMVKHLEENIKAYGLAKGSVGWGIMQNRKSGNSEAYSNIHKRLFGDKKQIEANINSNVKLQAFNPSQFEGLFENEGD